MKTPITFRTISIAIIASALPFAVIGQKADKKTPAADNAKEQTFSMGKTNRHPDLNALVKANRAKAYSIAHDYYTGGEDADNNYTKKKSGRGFVLAATAAGTPVLGIIPTLLCSVTGPSTRNLGITDGNLLNNAPYMKGYRHEAYYLKKRAIWKNYIMASMVWAGVVQLLIL